MNNKLLTIFKDQVPISNQNLQSLIRSFDLKYVTLKKVEPEKTDLLGCFYVVD